MGEYGQHICVDRKYCCLSTIPKIWGGGGNLFAVVLKGCNVLNTLSPPVLDEGERCDEVSGEDDRRFARDRIAGAADRFALSLVRSADVGCRPGLVCTRVELNRRECRPINENGK